MNDPHDNDPDISDNLRRIVPDDLSPAGLVDGARRKRNQRKSWVGAVAALAIVGFAVPVALNLPVDDVITAQPAATSKPTDGSNAASSLPGAAACYNVDGTPISWSQEESAPAKPGAVKAWLCGDYAPDTGMGVVGPLDPLTSGLDAIIKEVQKADEIDLTRTTCLADYVLAFNAVFEYEDGSRRIIGGERHGCHATYDGGTVRAGADEFYDALITAWQKQRKTDTGDWVVPAICPGPASLIEMAPWDAVQASLCGEGFLDNPDRVAAYLSDELRAEVVESLKAQLQLSDEGAPLPTSSAPEQRVWLTLSNKFTDYQTLVRHEDGLYRSYDGEGVERFWKPSPDLSAKLDAVLQNAGSTDGPSAGQSVEPTYPSTPVEPGPPSQLPQPWVPEACADIASGALTSTPLPDGVMPGDAERVWLCTNGVNQIGGPTPPMEALKDPGLVSQAADAFNNLASMPADQGCTMEMGPSYLVVHEYADGTRYAVEIQDYGCRPVIGGDVVKENSGLYTEKLLDLWAQQRTTEVATQARPAPLCGLGTSMFITDPTDVTFTSGVACVAPSGSEDPFGLPQDVVIPVGVMPQITDQLAAATSDPGGSGPGTESLVLLTEAGDPFVIYRQDDGTFQWPNGESSQNWAPTGAVAEALTALFGE